MVRGASLKKCHLNNDLKEVREGAMCISSRKMQRFLNGTMLGSLRNGEEVVVLENNE